MSAKPVAKKPMSSPSSAPKPAGGRVITGDTRFLAFVFAEADLVVEFDEHWQVLYGMAWGANGPEQVRARSLAELLDPASVAKVKPLQTTLKPATRSGPIEVALRVATGTRQAYLRAFRARELGQRLSCSFAFVPEESGGPTPPAPQPAPQAARPEPAAAAAPAPVMREGEFLEHAEAMLQKPRGLFGKLYYTFVELTGLGHGHGDGADEAEVERLLNSHSVGGAAGRVENGRYVLLTDENTSLDSLNTALAAVDGGSGRLGVKTTQTAIAEGGTPESRAKSLKSAVEQFATGEPAADEATLAAELSAILKDASAVRGGRIKLLFQPLVRMAHNSVQGFEARLRLPGRPDPSTSIRVAEKLGLAAEHDLAVARAAWTALERDRTQGIGVWVNASSRMLRDEDFVEELVEMTRGVPDLRSRFTLEIAEAAVLKDLEAADKRIRVLRGLGFKVCIDEFGAGTASFEYLRGLGIDLVKIDGRYVRDIATSERSRLLVRHFVKLCEVMRIETAASRVETAAQADTLKGLGVALGQGLLYGRPTDEPRANAAR